MTLRIIAQAREDETVVALHGRLTIAEVAEVEKTTAPAGRPLVLDLTHLVGADSEGFLVIHRLRESGAQVTGASPFVDLMLARVTTPGFGR